MIDQYFDFCLDLSRKLSYFFSIPLAIFIFFSPILIPYWHYRSHLEKTDFIGNFMDNFGKFSAVAGSLCGALFLFLFYFGIPIFLISLVLIYFNI
jgi:hypothetical protein